MRWEKDIHVAYEIGAAMFSLKVLRHYVFVVGEMGCAAETRPDFAFVLVEICFEKSAHDDTRVARDGVVWRGFGGYVGFGVCCGWRSVGVSNLCYTSVVPWNLSCFECCSHGGSAICKVVIGWRYSFIVEM